MSLSDGLKAREMVIASRLPEYRCTKNVIGVKPTDQNGSYIRAESAMMAGKKYLEKFPEDREVCVQLWKEVNGDGRLVLSTPLLGKIEIFR